MKNKMPLQIKDIIADETLVGQTQTIRGWVRTRRDSKGGFSFLNIHDGSCFLGLQVVVDQSVANYEQEVLQLTTGCSVEVRGTLVASQGKGQSLEMQAESLTVFGWVEDPEHYPVAKKRHSFEFLRSVAHLRPRTNTFSAMTRLRHQCARAIHDYFHNNNFFWVNTPIITASDCEGAGELFRVSTLDLMNLPKHNEGEHKGQIDFDQDFFGSETYLTVSGQLNVESFCLAMSRVYTFGPTFRAENSNTSRHLAEFWMVEPEIAFADLDMDVTVAEAFLKSVIQQLLDTCEDDLAFFGQHVDKGLIARLEAVVKNEFVRMEYSEAITLLQQSGKSFEFPVTWGMDLQSEHERYLAEEHINGPLVLMNYPQDIKAFYMRRNDDGRTCAAMDVLVPGIGEIIGGSQREDRADVLAEKMAAHGLNEALWWYQDLRRYGTVPHAGFGLGFERLLTYVTGMENIRDVIPFPRVPQHAQF